MTFGACDYTAEYFVAKCLAEDTAIYDLFFGNLFLFKLWKPKKFDISREQGYSASVVPQNSQAFSDKEHLKCFSSLGANGRL